MKKSTKITFLGAAQNVTGSRYLLETEGSRLLVDCGLYQERDLRLRNWDPFPVPPATIDAVLLTHAHVDHCGYLPKMIREGFQGSVYATRATVEIAKIVLLDSGHLQEEDAEIKRRRHEREGRKSQYPEAPLYTRAEAEATLPQLKAVDYEEPVVIKEGLEVSFHDAGHILGSAMIKIHLGKRTILFSGDVGRWDRPILRDPTLFEQADYVITESTYGDRLHQNFDNHAQQLAEIINTTRKSGGNVVIPSFAIERAQEVLYHLNELLRENRIPHLLVFMDSPMAAAVTEIFRRHPELFDEEMKTLIRQQASPFDFPNLKMVKEVSESKAINHIKGTVIIIAGSGMCTGGRIKHHLENNISRKESTILFVGYQAVGTLGRQIVDGAKQVRLFGKTHRVRARIAQMEGFSGHADRDELFRWLSNLKKSPRHVFVTHGEPEAAQSYADYLQEKTGWKTSVPAYRDEVILD